jgi:hypothetical protein
MAQSNLLFICASAFLTGCVATNLQPLAANDPGSPHALEAITSPAKTILGEDDATRRTRSLLAARARQDTSDADRQGPDTSEKNQMPEMEH